MTDGPADLAEVFDLASFEALARQRMTQAAFDYVVGGSGDELTMADNEAAFRRRWLRPRVLVDVSAVDPATTILGRPVALPVGVAPTAYQQFAHPDAESAMVRAAAAAGVLFTLSTLSSHSMEMVAAAAPDAPRWFQLYVHRDPAVTGELVARAVASGYAAIVLTVDVPMPGYRQRDYRNHLQRPAKLGNLDLSGARGLEFQEVVAGFVSRSLSWADLPWIRSLSPLPLVIKGVLTGEDAALAVEHGASAVWVSNHGGRQLDAVPAALDVLEEVVAAVGGRAEVYLDGGIRRATDVLIALGLGARGVFLGRPFLMALAAGGEAGVLRALALLQDELSTAMTLLGVRSLAEVTRAHVAARR
jgi:isopentenyl diphosphate isomerase/L-lactate dehydrogenase-like FMN-dependent dehydrogenase